MMKILEVGVIGAVIAAFSLWGQVRFILGFPIRLIIITKRVRLETAQVLLSYLQETFKNRPMDNAEYWSGHVRVKPLGRVYRVFFECLGSNRQLYFNGWKPMWYGIDITAPHVPNGYRLSYFRGTFDWNKLLADVAQWEDHLRSADEGRKTRFRITYHGAMPQNSSSLNKALYSDGEPPRSPTTDPNNFQFGDRLLHWDRSDLANDELMVLEHMSLRPEMLEIVNEIEFFLESKEWFEERGIPWRRGWLLHGKPGTGKTTFVRGISVKFDLPIHVFDLSSMSNHSFRSSWNIALNDAPCVALIEDIDTVFDGRANMHTGTMLESAMTYDCLLNCIGGISEANGVLLFISSNKPEKVDVALTRGGRLDRTIEVLGLDFDGRLKLAERILGDRAEAYRVADNPDYRDMTPAELQEILSRTAILRRFS